MFKAKVLIVTLFAASLILSLPMEGAAWEPLTDEERSSTQSEIDPNAGAEVLYKSIFMDGESPENSFREYYLRIKIYDERGAESLGNYRIVYDSNGAKLGSHGARIVKPDGTVDEIEKSEFFNQNIKNNRSGSLRSWSFSFPELEPGDIVDIKYRIDLNDYYYTPQLFVDFQEQWPLRRADIKVRPATWVTGNNYIKWMTSKCDSKGMKKDAHGCYNLSVGNFGASIDEPHQPPQEQDVAWLLFYVGGDGKLGDTYWKNEGSKLYRKMVGTTKPGKKVDEVVGSILDGISGEEEKLQTIYRYCTTEIVNSLHGEPDRLSADDRKNIDSDMAAEKVLNQGFGSPVNVNTVFCALARAAGFDARMAAVNSRDGYQFSRPLASIDTIMRDRCVAIKLGESWSYFDPGGRYLPFGQLDWQNENVMVLIADKKRLELVPTPVSQADSSIQKSKAKLELSEMGTLWGKVAFEFSGHFDVAFKRALDGRSPQEQREFVKNVLSAQWPRAAVSAIEISNAANPLEPLTIACDINITSYAEAIGDRLFLKVNVFQESAEPEFPETSRNSDMFFEFAKREIEIAEIKLPENFELEEASAPRPFENKGVFIYSPKLGIKQKSNTLLYSNDFTFTATFLPVRYYGTVKKLFDDKHAGDQHTITLKKMSTEASNL